MKADLWKTQDRMLKSAENWMAGFFGLEWFVVKFLWNRLGLTLSRTNNATIEVIIEEKNFNNSLAGSLNCPNNRNRTDWIGARNKWIDIYLTDGTYAFSTSRCFCFILTSTAVARFQNLTDGFEWTSIDVYSAQSLCSYETVAYGFSKFCDLFTYKEWQDFGYATDIFFSAGAGFHSPVGVSILVPEAHMILLLTQAAICRGRWDLATNRR